MIKEKKGLNKKVILLSLILLSFVILNIILVAAQASSDLSFWGRWKANAFDGVDAKILLFIITAIISYIIFDSLGLKFIKSVLISLPLAFVLTAFVTPGAVLGVFKTYETLPLTIATALPMILLFALTYLASTKNKGPLVLGQYLAWCVYGLFCFAKALMVWVLYLYDWNVSGTSWKFIEKLITIPQDGVEFYWFSIAIIISCLISALMVFGNKAIFKYATQRMTELEDVVVQNKMKKAANMIKNEAEMEDQIAGTG